MKPTEAISLQAFLVALSELDTTLPLDLQQSIHRLGEALSERQQEAIAAIQNLAERHSLLHQLYDLAGLILQGHYQSQEYTQRLLVMEVPENAAIALKEIAVHVLVEPDPQIAAQTQIRSAKPQVDHSLSEVQLFLDYMYRTAIAIEAQARTVLHALERQPLTIENLCYTLQLSADQVRALVQYLWNAGYIAQTTGSVFDKLFPMWRHRPTQVTTLDSPAYFTLTAKGHFHLHPIVTAGRREAALW